MTVRFFLTSSIPCIPWIWMNVFHLKKLSKKIAWHYQVIWIRWYELNIFSRGKRTANFKLALPKMWLLFCTKDIPVWKDLLMLAVTRCYGESLPRIFLPSFSWFREVLHLWKLPLPPYDFLKYLWVISPCCLRQKPKFLEQVHWCSSYCDVV